MDEATKAELRRLAEACQPYVCADEDEQCLRLLEFHSEIEPNDLIELLDECSESDGAIAVWRRRTQRAESDLDRLLGLLVQCALSAATLRADAPYYANHAGFDEQFTHAIRKASGVEIGHGVGSPKYPSQADAIAAMDRGGASDGVR